MPKPVPPLNNAFLLAGLPQDQDGFQIGPLHGTRLIIVDEGLCVAPLDNRSKVDWAAEDLKWAMDTAGCHSGIIILWLRDGVYLEGTGPYTENFLGAVPDRFIDDGISYHPYAGPDIREGVQNFIDEYKRLCAFMDKHSSFPAP